MKRELKNVIVPLVYQLNAMIWALLLPRMYLSEYGASIHGLSSTVSTIIDYVAILSGGIGVVAAQALYSPLSRNDKMAVGQVYKAIVNSYKRIALYYGIATVVIALVLPRVIDDEISSGIVIVMMLISGLQASLTCLLVNSNTTLIQADKRYYYVNVVHIVELNVRNVIQIILIFRHFSVLVVSFVPVLTVFLTWILLRHYIRNEHAYVLNVNTPNYSALDQKRSGMIHQIAGLIVNSTDVIVLTFFLNQIFVSIYSVYSFVITHLHNLINMSLSYGIVALFGQNLVNGDTEDIKRKFDVYELLVYGVNTIVYGITLIMFGSYVVLYANSVSNINYVDNYLIVLFVTIGYMNSARIPSLMLINAKGDFRQTQHQAIIESVLNLSVSLVLVCLIGIYGVLIGTVVSFSYRTVVTIIYTNKKILQRNSLKAFIRIAYSVMVILVVKVLSMLINYTPVNWFQWILCSMAYAILFFVIVGGTILLYMKVKHINIRSLFRNT